MNRLARVNEEVQSDHDGLQEITLALATTPGETMLCIQPVPPNHKGEPCRYKPEILCQEGHCSGCGIALGIHDKLDVLSWPALYKSPGDA